MSQTDLVERLPAKKCAKPGCGAKRLLGKPCTDWDCPQLRVWHTDYEALATRLAEVEREAAEKVTLWMHAEAKERMTARALSAALAENERLKAALKPFADAAGSYDGIPPPKYFGDTDCEMRYPNTAKVTVSVGHLRQARTALNGGTPND